MVRAASPPTLLQTAARSASFGRRPGGGRGRGPSSLEMENELHPKALRAPRCFFQTALGWDQARLGGLCLTGDRGPGAVFGAAGVVVGFVGSGGVLCGSAGALASGFPAAAFASAIPAVPGASTVLSAL